VLFQGAVVSDLLTKSVPGYFLIYFPNNPSTPTKTFSLHLLATISMGSEIEEVECNWPDRFRGVREDVLSSEQWVQGQVRLSVDEMRSGLADHPVGKERRHLHRERRADAGQTTLVWVVLQVLNILKNNSKRSSLIALALKDARNHDWQVRMTWVRIPPLAETSKL